MSSKKFVLTSSDGEYFEVEEMVARKMKIVRHIIEDECVINEIPLQNVTGMILALVIVYCKKHINDAEESEEAKKEKKDDSTEEEEKDEAKKKKKADSTEEEEEKDEAKKKKKDNATEHAKKELDEWDTKFMKNLDMTTIFKIILAANYLNVEGLLDLTSKTVADYIKDKTVEEVREIFKIENDYTPEEEAKVREENAWAFQ